MKRTTLIATDISQSPVAFTQGNEHTRVGFTPYGWNSEAKLPVGFKGEHREPTLHCYALGGGHRVYNPLLMRFNSPDKESPFAKGGINAYAFVLGDPINGRDPTGRFGEFLTSLYARLLSAKTYTGKFVAEFDGVVAFTGADRDDGRLPTVYLVGHGSNGYISGDDKKLHNAQSAYDSLTHAGVDMQGRQTHILACYTCLPNPRTGTSFIDDMSSLTGAQSSGYDAAVSVSDERNEYTVTAHKLRALSWIGTTSTKTRAGEIRNPQKLYSNNAAQTSTTSNR